MFGVIITLIILICILIVLVVLAQNSKGGGLSSQFGGSSTSNLIGVKRTTDLLEKITWSLAIALMVLSFTATVLISNRAAETGLGGPSLDATQSPTIGNEFQIGDDIEGLDLPPAEGETTPTSPSSTPDAETTDGGLESLLGGEEAEESTQE